MTLNSVIKTPTFQVVFSEMDGITQVFFHNDEYNGYKLDPLYGKKHNIEITSDCISLKNINESNGDYIIGLCCRNGVEMHNGITGTTVATIKPFSRTTRETNKKVLLSNFLGDSLLVGNVEGNLSHLRCSHFCKIEKNEYTTAIKRLEFLSLWPDESKAAIGGERSELILIDLDTNEKLYSARIHKGKSWAKCAAPLSKDCIVVANMYNNLHLYDVRAQKKPVHEFSYGSSPLSCITSDNDYTCWIGSYSGEIMQWNLRADRLVGVFKHNLGSISSLDKHPTKPFIVSGGEDRWLKIYDTKKRQIQVKMILRRSVMCIRFVID
eukprot:gnl/TRDRNA2_/TRDRNA2_176450_c0_seq1.p1 gnl/TRDRNA2_/TRDRNA2_176450_c0~~gnl/TRDRNA2_/TRDRNA2_176450_c0_seq1.p1  ORF type:complete len:323 (-),score=-28.58 gnl/TRDRNA2_/TRDRNA2_176450_c0_seq1:202-1170(-)